jgi:Tol biopolymer transport system component
MDQHLSLSVVRPDGGGRRLLLPSSRLSTVAVSWAPDGKTMAVVAAGAHADFRRVVCTKLTLYVLPIDGRSVSRLRNDVACDVAWSPRGDEIAYTPSGPDRSGTWSIRPNGTGGRKISTVGGGKWSADGSQLSFNVVMHLAGLRADRYHAFGAVDADGTGYHVVTQHAYTEYGEAWSPRGHRLLYGHADRKGLYVIGSDGRNDHRITRDALPQAAWGAFAWSPTARSVVYDTGDIGDSRTADTDLYLIGTDGRGKIRLTKSPDVDVAPSWVAH